MWKNFEILGLVDRYAGIIASVGYEYIEGHVLKTCTGEWAKPMLEDLRVRMSEKVVLWMLHVYVRGASNRMCYFLFLFGVVMTIKHSGRSENDDAGHWVAFQFSYKQDAMQSEVWTHFISLAPNESTPLERKKYSTLSSISPTLWVPFMIYEYVI